MATPKLSSPAALDALLKSTTEKAHLPAVFFLATNADETIYSNQAGDRVQGEPDKGQVNEDTPVELFSQTKLLTSIAALKLVEQGKLALDDGAQVDKYLPELKDLKILSGYDDSGEATFVPHEKPITLRHLLTHTSGLIYTFLESPLTKWIEKHGPATQFNGGIEVLTTPLIFEPGASWMYSHATDWVGLLIERSTGESLEEHFKKVFFAPLGMSTMTFYPTDKVTGSKMTVCTRLPDGGLIHMPGGGFGMGRAQKPEDVKILHGGAGLFGSEKDYLKLLRAILASDPARGNKNAFVSPEIYKQIFTDALSTDGNFHDMVAGLVNVWIPDDSHAFTNQDTSHSLACGLFLTDQESRRRGGSAFWGGVAKTQYWIDPKAGIAAIVGTNLLTDLAVRDPFQTLLYDFERTLYQSLA